MAVTKELATYGFERYAIRQAGGTDIAEVLRENLAGGKLSAFDFDVVKVPSGQGAAVWSVPSLDGDEALPMLEGVIVHKQTVRSYWRRGLEESGGSGPPDCSSQDAIIGVGDPGGPCATCPLGQFGSDGRGQACKLNMLLFVVREHTVLPTMVKVPPASVKGMRQYLLRLASAPAPFYGVVTRFTLEKSKSDAGIAYYRVQPKLGERLTPEDVGRMRAYGRDLQDALAGTALVADAD